MKTRPIVPLEWMLPTGTPAEEVEQIAVRREQLQDEFWAWPTV